MTSSLSPPLLPSYKPNYVPLLTTKTAIIKNNVLMWTFRNQNPQTLLVGMKMVQMLWKMDWQFLKRLNIESLSDMIPSLGLLQLAVVQSLSHVQLFLTPRTAAYQTSLSFTISQSLFKLMSIKSVMLFNHLILCCPLFRLPSIFLSIRVFSNESALHIRWPKYWSFSFNISPPMNIQG